jgi:peptidyl-prolyl cis-trans isomerase A (cyclophilin A)
MKNIIFLGVFFLLLSCKIDKNKPVEVTIETELGNILIELYVDKAPITCENFIKYIKNNMFEGASFYRVVRSDNQPDNTIKIEVIQGGLGFDVEESPYPPIKHENTLETGLLHKNGTLSMARAEPGTASSEFFICIGDQPALDFGGRRNLDEQGFAAFGKVVRGMDIVRKIQQMKDEGQMLINPVKIKSIDLLN